MLHWISKFGKLSRGHRTGKGQFSIQSQRRAMPKNVQTTVQLHSFRILVRLLCSKSFKLGFSSTWTKKFQMYKLSLEKAEEPDQIASIHWIIEKAREFQKNIYFYYTDYAKAFDCVDHDKLWKIFQEMGIPDHLHCLLRNLYAGQAATIRTGHGTTDCFQLGKEYVKAVYCHPVCLTFMQSTSWKMLGRMKEKLESRLPAGRNINNFRYADDTTLMAESKEELKNHFVGSWLEKPHPWQSLGSRSWHIKVSRPPGPLHTQRRPDLRGFSRPPHHPLPGLLPFIFWCLAFFYVP